MDFLILERSRLRAVKMKNQEKIHAAKASGNGAKLHYIHLLRFYQKSLTDPSKG